MFNDKCELTKAVLDGNKTMTRRDAKLFNKNTVVHGKKILGFLFMNLIWLTNKKKSDLSKVESNKIGLKSVKRIVELHEGTCSIEESEETFSIHISIPLKKAWFYFKPF